MTSSKHLKLTQRLQRIITLAEEELDVNTVLYPIDLVVGIFKEKTGVLGELSLKSSIDSNELAVTAKEIERCDKGIRHPFFKHFISEKVVEIINYAENKMVTYGLGTYLAEGQVIEAIFAIDSEVQTLIDSAERELIINLAATPRDLAVSLRSYTAPDFETGPYTIRRVTEDDRKRLYDFITENFNERWANYVNQGFDRDLPSVFIAVRDKMILGFSAYDVVRNKKGLFGPMGTIPGQRLKKIGYLLLHSCLNDMKHIGYEYTIIGNAGPIEFYERACGAVVIYR